MQVEQQDDIAFDMAFTEALGGASNDGDNVGSIEESSADLAPVDEGTPEEPQGAEPVTSNPSSDEEGTKPEATPTADPSPAPALNAELQQQFDEMLQSNRAMAAQIEEMKKPKAEAPTAPVEQNPVKPDAAFDKFAEEWPEVAKMMAAREDALKTQITELMQSIVAPVKQELLNSIQPVMQKHQQSEEDRFLNTVKSQHPDALDLLPEVDKWAATLPTYLKVGVDHALTKGTAEDVIALYNMFKKETGREQKQAPAPAVLDDATKKKMDKIRLVSSSRPSSPTAEADVNDYDGAFAQAVSNS